VASIGHVAVGMAAARAYDPARGPSWRSMALWSALSLLPDIDVVGFLRGVPYGAAWGHRGATHSLTLAILGGIVTGVAARWVRRPVARTMLFACVVLASHGLLDSMTDGGLGIALLWPFSLTRFFAPWRPIVVAPIGADFFTVYGATVAASEVVLFAPLLLYALWPRTRVLPRIATGLLAVVWLGAVWVMTSTDPLRERIVGMVLHEDTRFAPGYSEDVFRAIAVGDAEDVVRGRLGEPLFETVFFMPKDFGVRSAMEVGVNQLPPGCFGAGLKAGVVHDTHDRDICSARGVVEGVSKAEVLRILGTPTESCAEYSESPSHGHARLRMVCFLDGKVEVVFRRWI
jgi:inner membrane protein